MAIPSDYKIQKNRGNMSNYVDLHKECQRMWNKKDEVIIVATDVVEKNMKKYLGKISRYHNMHSLRRLAIPLNNPYPKESTIHPARLSSTDI